MGVAAQQRLRTAQAIRFRTADFATAHYTIQSRLLAGLSDVQNRADAAAFVFNTLGPALSFDVNDLRAAATVFGEWAVGGLAACRCVGL